MNHILQLHGERIVYPVPPGLSELMSDITREVLRDQPSQLYQYIADLLETMDRIRKYAPVASQLVDDVLGEKTELLAYVQSLGLTWEEVNWSARKIQGAFRKLKCRRDLRRKKEDKEDKYRMKHLLESSVSFQNYLQTIHISLESSSLSPSQLVKAYRKFKARNTEVQQESHRHASTHTIETFQPKTLTSLNKKRDSKLLTYQESPTSSGESVWSKTASTLKKYEGVKKNSFKDTSTRLVYEQTPQQKERYVKLSLSSVLTKDSRSRLLYEQTPQEKEHYMKLSQSSVPGHGPSVSTIWSVPEEKFELPSYDNINKVHIPMISRSGDLTTDNEYAADTLTLHSMVDDEQTSWSHVSLPFLKTSQVHKEPVVEGLDEEQGRTPSEEEVTNMSGNMAQQV